MHKKVILMIEKNFVSIHHLVNCHEIVSRIHNHLGIPLSPEMMMSLVNSSYMIPLFREKTFHFTAADDWKEKHNGATVCWPVHATHTYARSLPACTRVHALRSAQKLCNHHSSEVSGEKESKNMKRMNELGLYTIIVHKCRVCLRACTVSVCIVKGVVHKWRHWHIKLNDPTRWSVIILLATAP